MLAYSPALFWAYPKVFLNSTSSVLLSWLGSGPQDLCKLSTVIETSKYTLPQSCLQKKKKNSFKFQHKALSHQELLQAERQTTSYCLKTHSVYVKCNCRPHKTKGSLAMHPINCNHKGYSVSSWSFCCFFMWLLFKQGTVTNFQMPAPTPTSLLLCCKVITKYLICS